MNRNFLKELGLEDDAVNSVMAENGKDITKVKQELELSRETAKELQAKLDGFSDYDLLKDFKSKYEDLEVQYKKDVNKLKLENYVTGALFKANAKNVDIVKKSIDYSKISEENGVYKGLEEQISNLIESDSYLFKNDKDSIPSSDIVGLSNDNAKPETQTNLEKLFYEALDKTTY